MKYAAYFYNANKEVYKVGTLTYDSDTKKYTFVDTEPNINQGEIGETTIVNIFPDGSYDEQQPFTTILAPNGWNSGLLQCSTADWTIIEDTYETLYQVATFELNLVGYTYKGGVYGFVLGWLNEGSYTTMDSATYTVEDGVHDYDNIDFDKYEAILTSVQTTFADYAGRLVDVENYLSNAFDYVAGQTGAHAVNLYNEDGTAVLSFDGSELNVNINGTDYQYAIKNADNTFSELNTFVKKITAQNGIDINSKKLENLADGVIATDAVNKGQLDLKADQTDMDVVEADIADIEATKADITYVDSELSTKADLVGGSVPSSQLPSFVDDVLEFDTYADLPAEGEQSKLYVVKSDETQPGDDHSIYRWSGTVYVLMHDEMDASEIKTLYESNTDTNAYTDSEKTKLGDLYNQTQLEALFADRYTKSEVDSLIEGLKALKNVDQTDLTPTPLGNNGTIAVSTIDTYDLIVVLAQVDTHDASVVFVPNNIVEGDSFTTVVNASLAVNMTITKGATDYTFSVDDGTDIEFKVDGWEVGELLASDVSYDNTASDLAATDVKGALDELASEKIDKDYSGYDELSSLALADNDEIVVRDTSDNSTKKTTVKTLRQFETDTYQYGVREVVGQESPTLERVLKYNDLLLTGTSSNISVNVATDDGVVENTFDETDILGERKRVTIEADDGAGGVVSNTFVKVPKYYIKEEWTESDGTDYHYFWMCAKKLTGYRTPQAFIKPDGTERDFVYIGAYEAFKDANGKLRSLSGEFPTVGLSRAEYRTAARTLDTGDNTSAYQITDVQEYVDLVQIPMMIEFATKDLQSVMYGALGMAYSDSHVAVADGTASAGANTIIVDNATAAEFIVEQTIGIGTSRSGNQIASNRIITDIDADTPVAGQSTITFDGDAVSTLTGHYVYTLAWKTGKLDIAKASSALYKQQQQHPIVWRGIENPYGNIRKHVDGVKIVDNVAWVCTDPSAYDDAASIDGEYAYPYQKLNYINADANGYAKELGFDERFPFARFPVDASGGSSTYFADYYYQDTGDRTAFVGGYWAHTSAGGPFYWHLGSALGDDNIDRGARLSYRP